MAPAPLLPLNTRWRLVCEAVQSRRYAFSRQQLGAHRGQQIGRHRHRLGGHAVHRMHRSQHYRIGAAGGAQRDQDYRELPDCGVVAGLVREAADDGAMRRCLRMRTSADDRTGVGLASSACGTRTARERM